MSEQLSAKPASPIYRDSIVIDGTAPILESDWPKWHAGGVTAALATVSRSDDALGVIACLNSWYARFREHKDKLLHVSSADDIVRAKREGKLGVVFHFQNASSIGYDLRLLETFYRLGVRVIQLTYNVKNPLGDGCTERTNAGLSDFGVAAVKEMNRLGILVDCSHTGVQTTLDAMAASSKPVVFTHANARAICDHPRNVSDEQMRRIAELDGVVGLNGFPAFVRSDTHAPKLDDLLLHLDYMVKTIGINHVSLGLDYYYTDQAGYESRISTGAWKSSDYPPPPWNYPAGIDDASRLPAFAPAMAARGYSEPDIAKVLGGNLMRVFRAVWAP